MHVVLFLCAVSSLDKTVGKVNQRLHEMRVMAVDKENTESKTLGIIIKGDILFSPSFPLPLTLYNNSYTAAMPGP